MKLDENEFFREATLRICSNLDIEISLYSTFLYLNQVMPVSCMAMEYYDRDVQAMRTIAMADKEGGKQVDLLTPLSNEALKDAAKKYKTNNEQVYLFDNPKEEKLAQEMLEFHGIDATSLIVLTLVTGEQILGTLAVISENKEPLTITHANLLSLLSEPFAIALSNTLKHRNELKLFDREFFYEITKRICGHLEIEKGLQKCYEYISKYIPADCLYLEKYESDLGTNRIIAHANADMAESLDIQIPLPEGTKDIVDARIQALKDGTAPQVIAYNEPDVVRDYILDYLGEPPSSVMGLPLVLEGQVAGALTALAKDNNRYNKQHEKLFSMLRIPFFIAMSNTLKHRNELKLFDREFFYEVTMRISGNLEIEKGLKDCLVYLSQHIPADKMYLQKYEPTLEAMRVIARASKSSCEKMDQIIAFTDEAKAAMKEATKQWGKGSLPPVFVINKPLEEPVTKSMLNAMNEPPSSAMSLPLFVENKIAGTMVILAEGENRFNDYHAQLYHSLKVPFFVAMLNTLRQTELIKLKDILKDDNRFLQKELQQKSGDDIIGSNFGLKEVMEMVRQVADMDSPVLLLGETGTGKDLVANAIHYSSSRKDGPFISVNCGAIPESLIDSELFGHEKGAFTGALSQKRGRFERADKGTIFLDEVGELPLQAQVRLLRVLQNREIERVGGTKTISLDIRIIAATNKNLETMVKENVFREDLFFRLNVFPIRVPPLRNRTSDIPALIQHFINKKVKDLKLPGIPELEPGSIDILMDYHWPGNVRELENVVERALILNREGPINFKHLIQDLNLDTNQKQNSFGKLTNLDDINREHIQNILLKTEGKIHGPGGAAELLGINPSTLRNRMKKLGIN